MLSQANHHWFMFSKILLLHWEYIFISLLVYDPNHTIASMAESYFLPKSQNVYFSGNYKWSLKRFDGLRLCQVIDRTLLKKQFTLWKIKWEVSTFPKCFLRGRLTKLFSINLESRNGNNCSSDFMFIQGRVWVGVHVHMCIFAEQRPLDLQQVWTGFLLSPYHMSLKWCV